MSVNVPLSNVYGGNRVLTKYIVNIIIIIYFSKTTGDTLLHLT